MYSFLSMLKNKKLLADRAVYAVRGVRLRARRTSTAIADIIISRRARLPCAIRYRIKYCHEGRTAARTRRDRSSDVTLCPRRFDTANNTPSADARDITLEYFLKTDARRRRIFRNAVFANNTYVRTLDGYPSPVNNVVSRPS